MIMFLAWKNVAINFVYLLGMNQIWLVFTTKYKLCAYCQWNSRVISGTTCEEQLYDKSACWPLVNCGPKVNWQVTKVTNQKSVTLVQVISCFNTSHFDTNAQGCQKVLK